MADPINQAVDCLNCRFLASRSCLALPADWPPIQVNQLRACVVAIVSEYCDLIKPEHRVLEIGCGTWSPIRDYCLMIGAVWDGVDVQSTYYGKPTIATRIESVEALSFADESFDFVIGNQTLEHWEEFGCRPELGLWQCFRCCKPGGWVLLNVPIGFHGSRMFVECNLGAIHNLFRKFAAEVMLISRRRESTPLPRIDLLQGYRHSPGGSYNLDIRCKRGPDLPKRPFAYFFRSRVMRELLGHRPDYHFYRLRGRIARWSARRKQIRG